MSSAAGLDQVLGIFRIVSRRLSSRAGVKTIVESAGRGDAFLRGAILVALIVSLHSIPFGLGQAGLISVVVGLCAGSLIGGAALIPLASHIAAIECIEAVPLLGGRAGRIALL